MDEQTYRVTYTHSRANGITYSFEVQARDEEDAAMQAGMARAESRTSWFIKHFFYNPVKWERVSVERVR